MGNCLRNVVNKFRRRSDINKNIVLLIVGLDNAGKTLALKRIANDPDPSVMPTMGFRTVSLKHKFYSIKVFDVGGAPQIRSIWKKYYHDIHGLIYVVDASNIGRLSENKAVFGELMSHEHVAGKPILLLANKQDVAGAIDELDLVENLDVERAANEMRCPTRVETCSLLSSGQSTIGVFDGYKWLLETISKNYETLDHRIKAAQTGRTPRLPHNSIRSRASISSRASILSNPFKPIHELIADPKRVSIKNLFLVKNKTAPMSQEQALGASVILDPVNLLHEPKLVRPFTAPASTVVNIPGQVLSQ